MLRIVKSRIDPVIWAPDISIPHIQLISGVALKLIAKPAKVFTIA
jgi:hypothetical protein